MEGSFRILTPDTQVRLVLGNSDDPKMVFDQLTSSYFFFGVLVHFSLHVDFYSVAQLQSGMTLNEDSKLPINVIFIMLTLGNVLGTISTGGLIHTCSE